MTDSRHTLEITPAEAAAQLRDNAAADLPLLLDCRTVEERALARIEGDVLLPMHELPHRLSDLEAHRDRPIIVYCHSGVRSLAVAAFLRETGYPRACSLAGGIDRWSREVDPSVPRY